MCLIQALNRLPRSSDSDLSAHNVCSFSTPWGAFEPVASFQAHPCSSDQINFRILPGIYVRYEHRNYHMKYILSRNFNVHKIFEDGVPITSE